MRNLSDLYDPQNMSIESDDYVTDIPDYSLRTLSLDTLLRNAFEEGWKKAIDTRKCECENIAGDCDGIHSP